MMALALTASFANSSTLALAIHPGPCFGFVSLTLFSSSLAFLMSPISVMLEIFCELLRYARRNV